MARATTKNGAWRPAWPWGVALLVAACQGPEPADAGAHRRADAGRDAAAHLDATPGGDAAPARDAARAADAAAARDAGVGAAFTVLSLNLHCLETDGTAHATNESRMRAIAVLAAAERADALALQEVCDDGATSALAMLRDALEARTGVEWSAASAFAHLAWEGTAREASESVAVLARDPIVSETAIDHRVQGALRRVTVIATLASGRTIASVHLDHLDAAAREEQARELTAAALVAGELDVIVAGDFNARAGAAPLASAAAMGFTDASATLRADRIDHVLVHRGAPLALIEARMVLDGASERVSDHPGILGRFEPRAAPAVATTRIVARADVGFGHHLFARGDRAPLSWDRGWPMTNTAPGEWRLVLTELDGSLAFKTLIDDARWQLGPDLGVAPGETIDFAPSHE